MATILIVDDSLTDRRLVTLTLERVLDCTLLDAESGEAALEQIEQLEPDLVLTDLQMPGLTGSTWSSASAKTGRTFLSS